MGMSVCLHARVAVRVLVAARGVRRAGRAGASTRARAPSPWRDWLTAKSTLAVHGSVRDTPALTHSGFAALKVKDAVVDVAARRARRAPRRRHEVARRRHRPAPRRAGARRCSSTSPGEALHRRGYRVAMVEAPLKETLGGGGAGARRRRSSSCRSSIRWRGSGTLAIEHALAARGIAPGLRRRFGFERWPTLPPDGAPPGTGCAPRPRRWPSSAAARRCRRSCAPTSIPTRGRRRAPERLGRRRRRRDRRSSTPTSPTLERRWPAGTRGDEPALRRAAGARASSTRSTATIGARLRAPGRLARRRAVGQPAVLARCAKPTSRTALNGPLDAPAVGTARSEVRLLRYDVTLMRASPTSASACRCSAARAAVRCRCRRSALWPLMWVALVPAAPGRARRRHAEARVPVGLAHRDRREHGRRSTGWTGCSSASATCRAVEALPIMALLVGYQGLAFALFSWGVRRAARPDGAAARAARAAGDGHHRARRCRRSSRTTWPSRRRSSRP